MSLLPHETPTPGQAAMFAADLQGALPVLRTARLVLRAPRLEDFEYYAEIVVGPRGQHILEKQTREEAWFDFTNMVSTWILRGHGLWTIESNSDSRVLGFVVLGFEPGDHEAELGFMIRETAEGQGIAKEAANAARAYAFEALGMTTLVSTIDHDNARSVALAERLGATRDAKAEAAHNNEIRVYRHVPREIVQ